MNKELTPLEAFEEIMRFFNIVCTTGDMDKMNELAKNVRNALKENNQLKTDYEEMDRINDELNLGNHQLRDENIKLKRVVEIIKAKGISTCAVACSYDNYKRYSESCFRRYNPLNEEEYELIRGEFYNE